VAVGAARNRRLARGLFFGLLALGAVLLVVVIGVFGALFGLAPPQFGGYGPSAAARAEIPPAYLALYERAGREYGIDPWILAAIGSIETDHGRSGAPGVRSGVNAFGCCAGPMQFSILGPGSTWERYGVDGDHDGRIDVYDPADAIPAAARYLLASGAPGDYRAAIFAYNHADWYVNQVLTKAAQYRADTPLPGGGGGLGGAIAPPAVTIPQILANPRIALTAIQRADIRSGTLDPRLYATLDTIGRRHSIVVTAIRWDHSTYTVDGTVSNHAAGRAFDIGAVDGFACHETWGAPPRWTDPCGRLLRQLTAITGPLRSTELIYCWDPDGPNDPRGFARPDHCDHIHVGWDG
jgi:Transglycosylase SLT domain